MSSEEEGVVRSVASPSPSLLPLAMAPVLMSTEPSRPLPVSQPRKRVAAPAPAPAPVRASARLAITKKQKRAEGEQEEGKEKLKEKKKKVEAEEKKKQPAAAADTTDEEEEEALNEDADEAPDRDDGGESEEGPVVIDSSTLPEKRIFAQCAKIKQEIEDIGAILKEQRKELKSMLEKITPRVRIANRNVRGKTTIIEMGDVTFGLKAKKPKKKSKKEDKPPRSAAVDALARPAPDDGKRLAEAVVDETVKACKRFFIEEKRVIESETDIKLLVDEIREAQSRPVLTPVTPSAGKPKMDQVVEAKAHGKSVV